MQGYAREAKGRRRSQVRRARVISGVRRPGVFAKGLCSPLATRVAVLVSGVCPPRALAHLYQSARFVCLSVPECPWSRVLVAMHHVLRTVLGGQCGDDSLIVKRHRQSSSAVWWKCRVSWCLEGCGWCVLLCMYTGHGAYDLVILVVLWDVEN